MSTSQVPQTRGSGIEARVRDAIRKHAQLKVADLTEEQRARALEMNRYVGRGPKDIALYVVDGTTPDETIEATHAAERAERRRQRSESATRSAVSRSRYPDEIREAVKRGLELSGKPQHSMAGSGEHFLVREMLTERLNGNVTPDALLELAGVKYSHLRDIATFAAPRSEIRALRELSEMIPNRWAKGRYLAVILVVWIDELRKQQRNAARRSRNGRDGEVTQDGNGSAPEHVVSQDGDQADSTSGDEDETTGDKDEDAEPDLAPAAEFTE